MRLLVSPMPPPPRHLRKEQKTQSYGGAYFKNDSRFDIRSAGLSPKSERKISENDLAWSDMVLLMESDHRAKIRDLYRHLDLPPIQVLHIPDEYEFMDEKLIDILTDRVDAALLDFFGL